MYGFLHIPKTGGTALVQQIRSHDVNALYVDPSYFYYLRNYLGTFNCVAGHLPLFIFDFENATRKLFTVLREPRARVISLFNHIVNDPNHVGHRFFPDLMRWKTAFTLPPFCFEGRNCQTRMLGVYPDSALLQKAQAGDLRAFHNCYAEYLNITIEDKHLDRALTVIRGRVTVALHEWLQFATCTNFLPLVANNPESLPEVRVPITRMEVEDELGAAIDMANEYDKALVLGAREIVLRKAADDVLVQGELITLSGAPFKFTGLHELEIHQGEKLRWTDGKATLPILLPDSVTVQVEVEIWKFDYIVLECVSISAAGIQAKRAKDVGDRLCWQLTLGSKSGHPVEPIDLIIQSDIRSFSGDYRILGVPIKSIKLTACRK
jgi:hypothetical protein